VDLGQTFQEIFGFGGAFTEAAAYVLSLLPEAVQQQVIDLYFGPSGQNYTVGRVHMNSCDFSLASYSFDDTPGDFALTNFNTSHDQLYQMPMVKVHMSPFCFTPLNSTGAVARACHHAGAAALLRVAMEPARLDKVQRSDVFLVRSHSPPSPFETRPVPDARCGAATSPAWQSIRAHTPPGRCTSPST
jgi:hypothetical protein